MDSVGETGVTEYFQGSDTPQPDALMSDQARDILKASVGRSSALRSGRNAGAQEGRQSGPPTGPSRYYANNVSPNEEKPSSEAEKAVWQDRRTKRYAQRVVLRRISTLARVKKCGLVPNGAEDGGAAIVVLDGHASWSGYCSCGSIWACPVCQGKIRLVRADDYARMIACHLNEDERHTAWMVTLTAKHKSFHQLEPLFDAVANGWRRLISGRAWVGDPKRGHLGEVQKLGIRGWMRSLEVTWGSTNGFHPHIHVVLLMTKEELEPLALTMHRWSKTWQGWMDKFGFKPSDEHGVVWKKVTTPEEAGQYIAKLQDGKGLGNEMARGDMKSGKFGTLAMLEVLEYFRQTGDMAVIPVWEEYERGTFNRRAMTMSKGLRAELLPDEEEKTDEQIVQDKQAGDRWVVLPAESLRAMRRVPELETQLLDAAENGGFLELVNLLTAYHLDYLRGPDAPQDE